jgi:hypothetical protein
VIYPDEMQTRVNEYVDEGKPFSEFEQLKQDFEDWFEKSNPKTILRFDTQWYQDVPTSQGSGKHWLPISRVRSKQGRQSCVIFLVRVRIITNALQIPLHIQRGL